MALDFQPVDEPAPTKKPAVSIDFQPHEETSTGDWAKGVGEAALSFGTGIPASIAGGLSGLGTLNPDNVGKTAEALTYEPRTKEGKAYSKRLNEILGYLPEKAGDIAESVAGGNSPAARTGAEALTTLGMNFLPLKLGKTYIKGRKGPVADAVSSKLDSLDTPVPEAKPIDFQEAQMELPLENSAQQIAERRGAEVGQPDLFGPQNIPRAETGIPEIQPQVDALKAQEAIAEKAKNDAFLNSKQMEIDDTPHNGNSEIPFTGNQNGLVPHDAFTRIDENGMPIRADRSMEAQNLQDPLQRNLWGDELPRQSEQEAPRGITAAMDSMDPAARSEAIASQFNVPKSQRGALDFGTGDANKAFEKVGEQKVDPYTARERVVMNATGIDHIPRGDAPDSIIANAMAEGKDGPALWTHMQSGLQNAGEKGNSALMKGVARWLGYGEKVGDLNYANKVRPVERMLQRLSTEDLIAGQTVLRREMFQGREFTPEQLRDAGLSEKSIAAHQAMRAAFKEVLENTNKTLRALGKKELTPDNAYMASMWNGNWHVPIKDTTGKLAWYLKVDTKGEAVKAIKWLKDHPELSKTLDLDGATPKYHPQNVGSKVPRDVMGAYQDMLQFFDGDVAEHMKAAMEAYTQEQGFKFQQHQQHFKNKNNIRGFQGDRPWLSEQANAMAQAKAQMQYLKEAYRWAPMQEALANVKQVLAHPELNKMQPNNMELTKAYTAQAMGLSRNFLRPVEQALQKFTSSVVPEWAGGGNIGRFVSGMKNMTYLQQLGLSGGYMIATPLQAFLLAPAWHLKLSGEGFGHSAMMTSIRALHDFSFGLAGHEMGKMGKDLSLPMSDIGKKAFDYMKANGVISQNIFHENSGLGDNRVVHALKQTVGATISIPEEVARAATFMSFVHHLNASGKLSETAIFQRAEELTNHTLTDFRRMSRPLIVDRFGQAGEMAYVYKSPLFNQYNNLSIFARDALKGKPGPLLAALGMSAVLGGMTELPLVNEADKAWELLKSAVATTWPEQYHRVAGLGVKGTIISKMNELSANDKMQAALGAKGAKFVGDAGGYGVPSAATGSQLASRFSSKIGDVSNPLGDVAPVAQEMKEWAGVGHAAVNPTSTNVASGLWQNAPPAVKGVLENHGLPGVEHNPFKSVTTPQGQGYVNPNQLGKQETTYIRTPNEEFKRNFGLTSLDEATTKSSRYINQQEGGRFHQAQEASMDKMFEASTRKDKPAVEKYARAYFDNHGDGDGFEKELNKKLEGYMFTPEQRAVIRAQSMAALQNVLRMRKLQGH